MHKSATEFLKAARGFYFDLALTGYSYPLDLLQKFAERVHLLYGSDFLFAREKNVEQQRTFDDEIRQMGMADYVSIKTWCSAQTVYSTDSTRRAVAPYANILLLYRSPNL